MIVYLVISFNKLVYNKKVISPLCNPKATELSMEKNDGVVSKSL
jgi:hypothetical protein